ncbi:hypothetical protein [Natronorubrum sp. A-ect3]|uniref:PD-(D/E)XK nuclease domain-containing protein n=1 Tax=Natronorubrum sp. A-ect3 TaxID=3242698 RepID=UPI00359EAB59
MSIKLITEEDHNVNIRVDGVDIREWDYYASFNLDDDVLILDLKFEYAYTESKARWLCQRLFQIRDEIGQFLKTDGAVIVLLSDFKSINATIRETDYEISNHDILAKTGVSLSWGGGEHNCFPKTEDEDVNSYIEIADSAECYVEYENSNFKKSKELITRGEYGSTCGVALQSFNNSGNGSLIILPRPDDITVRSEQWFTAVMRASLPYLPQHFRNKLDQASGSDQDVSEEIPELEPDQKILRICKRFPKVARQLQDRYDDRDTIAITDEYDVQDLLHSLLWIEFDDIRDEEYSPSHAGSASRIDFLIKKGEIGIEVKYASENNAEKRLKKQIAEDKEHYQAHPDCEKLICFIYDPRAILGNPRGFEMDLSGQSGDLETTVVVASK